MLNNFVYSIAGRKSNQVVSDLIQSFLDSDYVPSSDKRPLQHALTVSQNGLYPSAEYFQSFFPAPSITYSNLAELVTYSSKVLDFYKSQYIQRQALSFINESNTSSELLSKLESLTASIDVTSDSDSFDSFAPVLYSNAQDRPESKGIMTGVTEIDEKTNGFQPGTISVIAAFTGQGKSTFSNSVLFKNALEGKKCALISLEMAPELLWPIFQTRYLYQVKGVQVQTQDIIMHKLPKDEADRIKQYDSDFINDICSNLVIVDESVLNKQIVTSPISLQKLFRSLEKKLGGLDLIVFDHVGQFELLYPTMGNQILKTIQSAVKTYQTESGSRPVTLWAVQTNREGLKRAKKRGVYDLQAISDLNEIERSASYILFMLTSDDDKINQETHMTLAKHRLGEVIPEPITVTFAPNVSTVGSSIETVSVQDSDFGDFGSFDFNTDDVF